jgi:hypothetical protein
MVYVSTPSVQGTHGGTVPGSIFVETVKLAMNDCSKIILQRSVLLMLENLGTGLT